MTKPVLMRHMKMNRFKMIENLTLKYKGVSGSVSYSVEDKVYYGKILNVRGLYLYEGNTFEELISDFKVFVEEYLKDMSDLQSGGVKIEHFE